MLESARFADRADAGRHLARILAHFKGPDTIVLGIPRGGVVVAHEVAHALKAPLDVLVVRKIGHHTNEEMAVGAIGPDGKVRPTAFGMTQFKGHEAKYKAIVRKEKEKLRRRLETFGRDKPPQVSGKTVIVVDDGIATGATLTAALHWLKDQRAKRIVVAVPCAHPEALESIRPHAHEVICPIQDSEFQAVGQYYVRFTQTTDAEVNTLLAKHRK